MIEVITTRRINFPRGRNNAVSRRTNLRATRITTRDSATCCAHCTFVYASHALARRDDHRATVWFCKKSSSRESNTFHFLTRDSLRNLSSAKRDNAGFPQRTLYFPNNCLRAKIRKAKARLSMKIIVVSITIDNVLLYIIWIWKRNLLTNKFF